MTALLEVRNLVTEFPGEAARMLTREDTAFPDVLHFKLLLSCPGKLHAGADLTPLKN